MPLPLIPLVQAGVGILQSILGGGRARRSQKALERLETPTYTPNQSIMDYYNKALERYNVSPQDSALYKSQQKNIQRGVATGLSALQDRRSALGGITKLIQSQNDATLNAEVAAENQKNQRFGVLGGATGMKAGEDRAAYQQNVIAPYEKKYNLLAMKAGAGAQTANAGLQNIFGALNIGSQMQMIDKIYGTGKSGGSKSGGENYDYENSPYWQRRSRGK